MKLKIATGLLIGALLMWAALSNVALDALGRSLETIDPLPLIPFVLIGFINFGLRVLRWQLILGRSYPVRFRQLFGVTMIGSMAVNLLPARLGELARPYLLSKQAGVPISTGLASLLIERLLDFLMMLVVLALVVFAVDLPTRTVTLGGVSYDILTVVQRVFLAMALPVVAGLVGLLALEEWMYRLLRLVAGRLMPRLAERIEAFFRTFMAGLRPLRDPKLLALQVALTLVIWLYEPVAEWLMFRAFHLDLGLGAVLTVMASILMGMLIPGPPGFAGNFEAFAMAGLAVFGVTGGVALGYALTLHWAQFSQIVATGLYFLYRDQISFRSLVKRSDPLAPETAGTDPLEPPGSDTARLEAEISGAGPGRPD